MSPGRDACPATGCQHVSASLGLSLTDTLAYFAALGAGLKVPVDIQKLIDDAARERANQPSLVA